MSRELGTANRPVSSAVLSHALPQEDSLVIGAVCANTVGIAMCEEVMHLLVGCSSNLIREFDMWNQLSFLLGFSAEGSTLVI